jgi:hypothetical protein
MANFHGYIQLLLLIKIIGIKIFFSIKTEKSLRMMVHISKTLKIKTYKKSSKSKILILRLRDNIYGSFTCNLNCQSYTEQYQHNRQDSRLRRRKSMGRKMACERKEGRGYSRASPLFSFSQILALLLVINNSILNI